MASPFDVARLAKTEVLITVEDIYKCLDEKKLDELEKDLSEQTEVLINSVRGRCKASSMKDPIA